MFVKVVSTLFKTVYCFGRKEKGKRKVNKKDFSTKMANTVVVVVDVLRENVYVCVGQTSEKFSKIRRNQEKRVKYLFDRLTGAGTRDKAIAVG